LLRKLSDEVSGSSDDQALDRAAHWPGPLARSTQAAGRTVKLPAKRIPQPSTGQFLGSGQTKPPPSPNARASL